MLLSVKVTVRILKQDGHRAIVASRATPTPQPTPTPAPSPSATPGAKTKQTQAQLAHALFPVGHLTKPEVRAEAERLGLAVAAKPDSQDICFVPDGDYARFVERAAAPGRVRPGRVVDSAGRALADHDGVHRFTVGQRRGLGLSAPAPLYVREIRAESGEVVVGPRADLAAAGLVARGVSFVDPESVGELDTIRYAELFRGLLERGIYLAPSQYECMFPSLAHGDEEIDATIEAFGELHAR
jgi:hypothetical protein